MTVQNYLSSTYNVITNYASYSYNNSVELYAKLPEIGAIANNHFTNALDGSGDFLWSHKEWVIGGIVIGVALLALYRYVKNRTHSSVTKPEPSLDIQKPVLPKRPVADLKSSLNIQKPVLPKQPIAHLESSLNVAKLTLTAPKEKPVPPKVTVTLLIDTSGSMEGPRIDSVVAALRVIFKNALEQVDKGASIGFSVVGFDNEIKVIASCEKHKLKELEDLAIKHLSARVKARPTTDLLMGLKAAVLEVEKNAKLEPKSSHNLIGVTDGDEKDKDGHEVAIDQGKLEGIKGRIKTTKCRFFMIGEGQDLNEKTLKQIVKGLGTFINATKDFTTIETSMTEIFKQVIAPYKELTLTSSLPKDSWMLLKMAEIEDDSQTIYDLGSLSEEKSLSKIIQINWREFKAPYELSTVSFKLSYKDPKGTEGEIHFAWNPNTKITPAVMSAYSKEVGK